MSDKVVLNVSLDLTANPPVVISQRNLKAGGKKIRWKHEDSTHKFKFVRLNELSQVYFNQQSIDLDQEMIRCNNRAPDTDDEFEYEIVVEYLGNLYTSTESGVSGGKPVIRNR